MLVELPNRRGVGKLVSATNGRCSVSVFHSMFRSEVLELQMDEIGRAYLSRQTRVYVKQDERFCVGRVTNYLKHETGLVDYEVRFPNGREADFSELHLFVRPWNAPEDPAEVLAAGGAESQFLHDRRQSAMVPLLALRSAAQGLTALLSAGIDFVPHQIAAVRRVLTDPIQRYLLADEVGLGKTIEAGLIIRQHLIDNPATDVLIATPQHLCEQWRTEMVNKLRLDQFGDAFKCCSHAEIERVSRAPDILVVDEAHHLVSVQVGALSQASSRLTDLARESPILLLLSATPALGEEAKFLALLNLLDPLTHPLNDLVGFRAKLQQRRNIGRLLLSLDPDGPGLVLRQRGAEVQRLFPDDPTIAEIAPRLIEATRSAPSDVAALCSVLKEHIADSYRIHQRLIRSRRADAKGWEFMPRGPAVDGELRLDHVRVETDPDEQLFTLLAGLEDWRFAAIETAQGNADLLRQHAARYGTFIETLGVSVDDFASVLDEARPGFDGESEIFESLRSKAGLYDESGRTATMIESTKRLLKTLKTDANHPKVIVFASSTRVATTFHAACRETCDDIPTFLLIDNGDDASSDAIDSFVLTNRSAILVTDRRGEEGLNLNFADAIVHLDLPMSAARLEQRIGRLDRFGRRQAGIRHRILLPSDEDANPWSAWFHFLSHGLLIFNRSISDVQFLLDEIEGQALSTLFRDGPDGLVTMIEDVRQRIAEERRSQDEQYALDRITLSDDHIEQYVQALEHAEENEQALETDVDRWLVGVLQLKKSPYAWPQEDPFKLEAVQDTLIPRSPWLREFEMGGTRPLTWRRRLASKHPEATLLRPGTPLIDVAERFTRWDDRGTTFLTWRVAPKWADEPWIGFRLCFVIEPSVELSDLLAPTYQELAAMRRAQRYLAPRYHVVHVDVNGDAVTDSEILAILQNPYNNSKKWAAGTDVNLGSRPQMLAKVIDTTSFQQCCRNVRESTRAALRATPEIVALIANAEKSARSDLDRRRNRLARRQSAGDSIARADIAMIEAILPSVKDPSVRLDAMGCFVISQHIPCEFAHE